MSKGAAVAEHDGGYKTLFSHPEMVADLLRDFIHEDWVRELDFKTLRMIPGNFVTPELSSRECDVLWQAHLFDGFFVESDDLIARDSLAGLASHGLGIAPTHHAHLAALRRLEPGLKSRGRHVHQAVELGAEGRLFLRTQVHGRPASCASRP